MTLSQSRCQQQDRAEQSPAGTVLCCSQPCCVQGGWAGVTSQHLSHQGSCTAPRARLELQGQGASLTPALGISYHGHPLPWKFPALGIPCPGHSPGVPWGREQSNPHAGIWHPPSSSFPRSNTHCRNMVTPRT